MARISRRVALAGGIAAGFAGALAIVGYRHRAGAREPGLIGLWTFDEGRGTAIIDSSGLGNDGQIYPPDRPVWGEGAFARTVSLSGADSNHIWVPPSESLNSVKSAVTVAATVYPRNLWTPGSTIEPFQALVQRQWREVFHPDQYYLGFGQMDNTLYYKWHVGLAEGEGDLYRLPPGEAAPAMNAWTHVAGTFDSAAGRMALFINGQNIGETAASGDIRLDDESLERPLLIGAELNTADLDYSSGEFDGYMREVRLYNRALSDAEIAALAKTALSSDSAA